MRQTRWTGRTWPHPGQGAWRPLGVYRLPCGCWRDGFADQMWEPCVVHEGEGHLAAISGDQDGGMTVARCLVGTCAWRVDEVLETSAYRAAQRHWEETRGAVGTTA